MTQRLLVLSHAGVLGVNRAIYRRLAAVADVEVALVVPARWRSNLIADLVCTPEADDDTIRLFPIPVWGRRLPHNNSLFVYRQILPRALGDWQPDLVLVEEEPWSAAAFQAFASFAGKHRFFVTAQNLNKRYPPPFRHFERAILRWAEGAFVRAHACADVLRAKGFSKPVSWFPHSYDPLLFHPVDENTVLSLRAHYRLPTDGFLAGYVGRLTEQKGIEDLLEAWAEVPQDVGHLAIIGNGELASLVTQHAEVDQRIVHMPAVPHNEVGRVIGALDVLILPSRTTANWVEQWGRVIVEAAACGVPVIGSSSGEIPRLIARLGAGVVVPERNPAALAQAIVELAADPVRRKRFGQQGAERARATLSHDAVARSLACNLGLRLRPRDVDEGRTRT